jgi:hypothetical protein
VPQLDRIAALEKFTTIRQAAITAGETCLGERVDSHLAYLEALLGKREPLPSYVLRTQGCHTEGWSQDYVTQRGKAVQTKLAAAGISWDTGTDEALADREGRLDLDDARDAIAAAAAAYEPATRALTGSDAEFNLSIEVVSLEEYWAYWVDGIGSDVRLRINLQNARFTKTQAIQFALHEILGHGLQCASFSQTAATEPVSWVRLSSVHSQQQVMLEGLAQALPLFIATGDSDLQLRVELTHYLQLVMARLHLALNTSTRLQDCIDDARRAVPFWTDEKISNLLADRGVNPLFRSYMWAYPAGLDWFVQLAETRDQALISGVFRAAYKAPLTPAELESLWPGGPRVGG